MLMRRRRGPLSLTGPPHWVGTRTVERSEFRNERGYPGQDARTDTGVARPRTTASTAAGTRAVRRSLAPGTGLRRDGAAAVADRDQDGSAVRHRNARPACVGRHATDHAGVKPDRSFAGGELSSGGGALGLREFRLATQPRRGGPAGLAGKDRFCGGQIEATRL